MTVDELIEELQAMKQRMLPMHIGEWPVLDTDPNNFDENGRQWPMAKVCVHDDEEDRFVTIEPE